MGAEGSNTHPSYAKCIPSDAASPDVAAGYSAGGDAKLRQLGRFTRLDLFESLSCTCAIDYVRYQS